MWTDIERAIFKAMLNQSGVPYIWQGKGGIKWTPAGPLPMDFVGYDCSGLFGFGANVAGLKDRRMTNSAQTWMDELERYPASIPLEVAIQTRPVVCFFGHNSMPTMVNGPIIPSHASHIALGVSMYGELWVVEASGGDETTTTIAEANRRGAKVRFGPLQRHDLIAYSKLPTT